MKLTEVFTPGVLAHYNESNGTMLDGRTRQFVSASLICTCNACTAIRTWKAANICPTCHRPL